MSGPKRAHYLTDPGLTGFNVLVGDNLRRIRISRGLTRSQLAELSGLVPRNIERVEDGIFTPSFWTVVRMAAALRTPLGALTASNDL